MTDNSVASEYKYVLILNEDHMKRVTGLTYNDPRHYPCMFFVFTYIEDEKEIQRSLSIPLTEFSNMINYINTQLEYISVGKDNLQ